MKMVVRNSYKFQRYVDRLPAGWRQCVLCKISNTPKKCAREFSLGKQHYEKGPQKRLADAYTPCAVEPGLNELWSNTGVYQPKLSDQKYTETFSMLLPPPNVTGTLHLGHSLTVTLQDVLARWHRMQGKNVVWIPGLDHAGIATQTTFERKLWKERNLTRYDIGREELWEELWRWKKEKRETIIKQLKRMGATLDWSREYFTLDSDRSEAVSDAFIRLYEDGLIYRSKSIINWSCNLQSAISDIEVDHMEVAGATLINLADYEEPVEFGVLTNFAYKSQNDDGELVVSTTRLETMLGDTAVAVHPSDERYTRWHGAQVWHPIQEKLIPVICDEAVDPKFGTGVIKVTPAHSLIDFEIGKKNNLELLTVIDESGKMNNNCGKYTGLKRFEARQKIKDELVLLGLFREQKSHAMSIPFCSRSGDIVEFLLKPQWFLSCGAMSKVAMAAVESGELIISPPPYTNVWYTWLSNIRDWCISRQLWWGHRIPAYECHMTGSREPVWVAARDVEEAKYKAAKKLNLLPEDRHKISVSQDCDVLDTWFSSALLPFSSLGWPKQMSDYKDIYPLSVMETGYDILFFWVARMVMLGTYFTGTVPFKKVVLHGVISDMYGRKMSKSLGNVIDPQDVISGVSAENLLLRTFQNYESGIISDKELQKTLDSNKRMFPTGIPECGSDALRFTLCSQNIANLQVNFDVDLCRTNRQFCNKIWQACRYIERSILEISADDCTTETAPLSKFDRWIMSRLAYLVLKIHEALSSEGFHVATDALRNFIYDEFCSTYLETTKPVIKAHNSSSVKAVETLKLCMNVALHSLSPFMPNLTEHLYQHLAFMKNDTSPETIALAPYPSPEEWQSHRDKDIENEIQEVLDAVSTIRHLKSVHNISKKDNPKVFIVSNKETSRFKEHENAMCSLTGILKVEISNSPPENIRESVYKSFGEGNYIYMEVSKKKIETPFKPGKLEKVFKELEKLQKMTSHPKYISNASVEKQKKHRQRMVRLEAEIEELRQFQDQG